MDTRPQDAARGEVVDVPRNVAPTGVILDLPCWQDADVCEQPDRTVEVVPYDPAWPIEFESTRAALASAVGDVATSIEHIGSTAVPGLAAKPTIDILMVVESTESFLQVVPKVEALGFDYRRQNTFVGSPEHLFLRKVQNGKRTHHLHVLRLESPEIDEYRRFRDALRADPAFAREYESLKLELAARHGSDRMRYVEVKSDWVDERLNSLPPSSA